MADDEERVLRPFTEWLTEQRKGKTVTELAEALADVNRAVVETGKPGSLTFTVKIKSAGDDGTVFVTDDVKTNIPQPDRGQSVFFVDDVGNAHRSQQELDLHPTNQPSLGIVRDIKPGAEAVDPETGVVR